MANAAQSTDQGNDQPVEVAYNSTCQHWHDSMLTLLATLETTSAESASQPDTSECLRMIEDHAKAFLSSEGAGAVPANTSAPHVAALMRDELAQWRTLEYCQPDGFTAIVIDAMRRVDESHIIPDGPIEE